MHSTIKAGNRLSIIYGGMSPEHSASLKSFEHVYSELVRDGADIDCIYYVDRKNRIKKFRFCKSQLSDFYSQPHESTEYVELSEMKGSETFLLNLLHGRFGEDGCIQGMAEIYGIRMSSPGVLPAALTMNKHQMNSFVKGLGLNVQIPETICVDRTLLKHWPDLLLALPHLRDVVIKPNALGASLMTERHDRDSALNCGSALIETILKYDETALVQQLVKGGEFSVGCIQNGSEIITLPVVEITTESGFFGHDEKHKFGRANETVIRSESELHQALKEISANVFRELGCAHMCRFDYIVSDDGIYFLEANYIPGLMKKSIFPKMLEAQGITIAQLIQILNRNVLEKEIKKSVIDYHID